MSLALKEAREKAIARLDEIAKLAEQRALTEEELAEFEKVETEVSDIDKRWDMADKARELRGSEREVKYLDKEQQEVRHVARPAGDTGEHRERIEQSHRDPGHYRGAAGGHSWLTDQYRGHKYGDQGAQQRIEEENRYGKQWRENALATGAAEARDLTMATDTDGGALTPVMYLQEFHAQLRRAGGATLNVCRKLPLPTGTDQVSIPVMSTGVSSSIATENNAVSETDVVWGTNVTADVVYRSSLQDISLQLLEQSNPAVEQIIMTDILKALVVGADQDVLYGTTPEGIFNADSTGAETYTAGTATFQGLYARIVAAVNDVWTNFYGTPTHIIMHPRRWAWCLAQTDADNRPFLSFNPKNNAGDFDKGLPAEGVVGNLLGIPVVIDANVRTTQGSGTDEDEIAVVTGSELFLFMREPKLEVDFSAGFKSLQASVRGYLPYAFTAERYPASISLITGTGLNDTI